MAREIVSRFHNGTYTHDTFLLPDVAVRRTPLLGTVLYDSHAQFRPIRDYRRLELTFPAVYARHIAEPVLTEEFVIHDERHLYVDGSIHVASSEGRESERVAERMERVLAAAAEPPLDVYANESAMVMHNEGGGTWGHFLVQNFPRALLYLRHFPGGRIVVPRRDKDRLNNNFARLFAMFGIPEAALIPVDRGRSYRFRELILVDFLFDFPSQAVHPIVLDLLDGGCGTMSGQAGNGRLYLERIPGNGTRSIENRGDLAPILARHGLVSRTLGLRPVQHQAAWWRSSALVVGTLGSDLANMVFGREGTRLLVLSPDWFGDALFYQLAVAKGMQWNELRCGRRGEGTEIVHRSNFWVDPDLLDTMLDTLAPTGPTDFCAESVESQAISA